MYWTVEISKRPTLVTVDYNLAKEEAKAKRGTVRRAKYDEVPWVEVNHPIPEDEAIFSYTPRIMRHAEEEFTLKHGFAPSPKVWELAEGRCQVLRSVTTTIQGEGFVMQGMTPSDRHILNLAQDLSTMLMTWAYRNPVMQRGEVAGA